MQGIWIISETETESGFLFSVLSKIYLSAEKENSLFYPILYYTMKHFCRLKLNFWIVSAEETIQKHLQSTWRKFSLRQGFRDNIPWIHLEQLFRVRQYAPCNLQHVLHTFRLLRELQVLFECLQALFGSQRSQASFSTRSAPWCPWTSQSSRLRGLKKEFRWSQAWSFLHSGFQPR